MYLIYSKISLIISLFVYPKNHKKKTGDSLQYFSLFNLNKVHRESKVSLIFLFYFGLLLKYFHANNKT